MISTTSRYYGQPLLSTPTRENASAKAIFRTAPLIPSRFLYYTIVAGDRLDTVANRVYGAPELWWRLADANPELFYPDALLPGMIIRIPA
jgi:nucleoid-associated protein YgaU